MKIDAFRIASFENSNRSHAMCADSERTLCGKSTAPETAHVWDVTIPHLPSCITCLGRVTESSLHGMFNMSRAVLAYQKNPGGSWFTYRGDFQVQVSHTLCNRAENWGLENAAKKARYLIDPGRELEMHIEVLNPETLYYERFTFEVGEIDPSQ